MNFNKRLLVVIVLILALLAPAYSGAFGAITTTYEASPFSNDIYRATNFSDVSGHWAREHIYRMAAQSVLRGDGQGRFRPQAAVTREEALALILRMAGLDEEAEIAAENLSNNGNASGNVSDFWARGYLQVAASEGIITPVEQDEITNNKNKQAQRQEVAAWLGKGLELAPIYGTDQQLVHRFTDAQQFNQAYLSAIELLVQQRIMTGDPNGSFRPRSSITRGEMAAVLDRVDREGLGNRNWQMLEGIIKGKNNRWEAAGTKAGTWVDLDIQLPGLDRAEIAFRQREGFPVYKNNKLGRANDLTIGDRVEVIINPEDQAVFAQALSSPAGYLDGYLLQVSTDGGTLQIEDPYSQEKRSLPISSQVAVLMDGRPASLDDLLAGQELSLTVNGNTITQINATLGPTYVGYETPPRETIKVGRVRGVSGQYLTIVDNDQEETFRLSHGTQLMLGSRPIKAPDLRIGDRVRLTIADSRTGELRRVEVSAYEGQVDMVVRGRLNGVYPEGNKISLLDPQEHFYGRWYPLASQTMGTIDLAGGADIYLGNRLVSLDELRRGYIGHEVMIALADNPSSYLGNKMVVRDGDPRPYNGIIEQVSWPANRFGLAKRGETFLVDDSTIAIRDGKLVEPGDFRPDEHVFLETVYANGGEYTTLMEHFQGMPPRLQVYFGRIHDIKERSVDLRAASQLVDNEWRDFSTRRRLNFDFDNRTRIWDGWKQDEGRVGGWITPDQLAESRWSEEYILDDVFAIVDENDKILAMTLKWYVGDFDILKTSIARVSGINRDGGKLIFHRVQDWSPGYQRWVANPDSLSLDVSDSLFLRGSFLGSIGDLAPGDVVYLVHDQREGYIIIKQ